MRINHFVIIYISDKIIIMLFSCCYLIGHFLVFIQVYLKFVFVSLSLLFDFYFKQMNTENFADYFSLYSIFDWFSVEMIHWIFILNRSYFTLFLHSLTLYLIKYLANEFVMFGELSLLKYYLVMITLSFSPNYVE